MRKVLNNQLPLLLSPTSHQFFFFIGLQNRFHLLIYSSCYSLISLDSEIELWCSLWTVRKIEKEALQQFCLTNVIKEAEDFFPHIQKALIILLTLPCTTATIERTFLYFRKALIILLTLPCTTPTIGKNIFYFTNS